MNEQLLKMNGLSVGILDALSFESHLGIPLKKNLHYFDKDLLIAELISMTEWLDEQEILSNIALDYRVKSLDSILLKYDRYYPDHQTRKVFNDILGFRAFVIATIKYWRKSIHRSGLLIWQKERQWMMVTGVSMCTIRKVEGITP